MGGAKRSRLLLVAGFFVCALLVVWTLLGERAPVSRARAEAAAEIVGATAVQRAAQAERENAPPAADPAALAELRALGVRVLETFELKWGSIPAVLRAADSLGISARIARALSPDGKVDEHALARLGSALNGHEEELVAAVLAPAYRHEHRSLVSFLCGLDTPGARRAALHLAQWDLENLAGHEDVWNCAALYQQLVPAAEGAEELLPRALAVLRSAPSWGSDADEVAALSRQVMSCVARADTPESTRALRELLESPDETVRTTASDAVIDAITAAGAGRLADSLRAWAADVSRGTASPIGIPRLAWLIHASEGAAALDTLLAVQIPSTDTWDPWFADYRTWMRAVLRAAEHAEAARARPALFGLIENAPRFVTNPNFEERLLVDEAIARLGSDEDFEFLRHLAEQHEADAVKVVNLPAQLWKGHESVLVDLLGTLAKDVQENQTYVELGATTLVRLGVDPGVPDRGDPAMTARLAFARQRGASLAQQDRIAEKLEELKALAPLERVRALAAALPGLPEARGAFVEAVTAIAREAAVGCEGPVLEAALLDPALPLAEARLPLLAEFAVAVRADRLAILGRVLPVLIERDCPKSAWGTLQATALVGVLEGRAERAIASAVLALWDACAPRVRYRKPADAVVLLREFLARAEALGVDRVFD